jgi:SAM-dependent methyltransferase
MDRLYEEFVERGRRRGGRGRSLAELKALFDEPPPNVSRRVSPRDTLYVPEWQEHYFRVGNQALHCIRLAMIATGKLECPRILDLGCGYGRVLRVLRAAFPRACVTACDSDGDAANFCARAFRAVPVSLTESPEDTGFEEPFDLIWAGSLLGHLRHEAWPPWLRALDAWLKPGGLLAFACHGRESARWLQTGTSDYALGDASAVLRAYRTDGSGYQDYPAHTRKQYGVALSSPACVVRHLADYTRLRLVMYLEKGWNHHQDVVVAVQPGSPVL